MYTPDNFIPRTMLVLYFRFEGNLLDQKVWNISTLDTHTSRLRIKFILSPGSIYFIRLLHIQNMKYKGTQKY